MINFLVVDAFYRAPGERAALRRGEVFDRVKAERRKIRHRSHHFAVIFRSESVSRVRADRYSSYRALNVVRGFEKAFFAFDHPENAIVIARHAAEIDRDNNLGFVGYRSFERVVVHL